MSDVAETIGTRLRQVRGDLTQAEFAAKIGVNKSLLGKYERDESAPGAEQLLRYKERAAVSVDWLLTGETPQATSSPPGPPGRASDPSLAKMIWGALKAFYELENIQLLDAHLVELAAEIYDEAMAPECYGRRGREAGRRIRDHLDAVRGQVLEARAAG